MKTLTEFFGTALKNALKVKEELIAAGKTVEELPAALGEALKIEGDKLKHMMSAIEAVGSKWDNLKRVVVGSLHAGEAAPGSAQLIGEVYFSVEHYPAAAKPADSRDSHSRGRDGKGGKGKGKGGGRGGRDGGRDGGDDKKRGGGGLSDYTAKKSTGAAPAAKTES